MKTRTLTNRMEKSSSRGFSRHCAEQPSSASSRQTPLDDTDDGGGSSRAEQHPITGLRTPRATPPLGRHST